MKNLMIVLITVLLTGIALGQNPKNEKVTKKIEAHKIAFITKTLNLTPEESQHFWPLYNEYTAKEKELKQNFTRKKIDKNMSDEEAREVINMFFDNQQKKLNLTKNYYKKFQKVLPPSKVVKLHFAEKKFKSRLLQKLRKNRAKRKERRSRY